MVEGVDEYPVSAEYAVQSRVGLYVHAVCRFRAVGFLRVLYQLGRVRYVLTHLSAQCDGYGLHAAAYPQYGHLAVAGEPCGEKLGQVACLIDVVQTRLGLLSIAGCGRRLQ